MPGTRVRLLPCPRDAAPLERLTDRATRARVGPASPLFAHAPGRAPEAFAEKTLRGALRAGRQRDADGGRVVTEVYARDAPPVATALRGAAVWPRRVGAVPGPGDGGVPAAVVAHVFRARAVRHVEVAVVALDEGHAPRPRAATPRAGSTAHAPALPRSPEDS